MEEPILYNSGAIAGIDDLHLTAIINQYCLEFKGYTRYIGIPEYDDVLSESIKKSGLDLHLKINFPASGVDIYIPLVYFSETGSHVFQFPAFQFHLQDHAAITIDMVQFLKFAFTEARIIYPEWGHADQEWLLSNALTVARHKLQNQTLLEEEFLPVISGFKKKDSVVREVNNESVLKWFQQQLYEFFNHPDRLFDLNEILQLVGLFGRHKVIREKEVLKFIYQELKSFAVEKHLEDIKALLLQRYVTVTGQLFGYAGSYTRQVYNPLHHYFHSSTLLTPLQPTPVFYRDFDQEGVVVTIRPFDIKKDLTMVHEWFHSDHAKTIWKMDWSLKELEHFYRTLLAEEISHSYIGEVNGEATFNFEVYWATRDILGDFYDVWPSDYGTHLFIAPTDKRKKFPSLITRSIVEWLFIQPEVSRLVGEGSVDSLAALMNKVQVGFKLQHVIEMPHKKAYLNFCLREWYWEKFPQNRSYLSKSFINEHA